MRSQLLSWIRLLTKLGFTRKKRLSHKPIGYRRNLRFEHCEERRMLATFMVTNNADAPENTPAAVGTLRQAIFDANLTIDADTIEFDPAFFNIPRTITLTQGVLLITESVTIDATVDGAGNNQELLGITINGGLGGDGMMNGNGDSVIGISGGTGTNVEINGLTLTGGDRGGASGVGGINSFFANLTLRNTVITGNAGFHSGSAYDGGVSVRYGDLTVENSIISGNTGRGIAFRGANYNDLTVRSTLIRDNSTSTTENGGGLYASTLNACIIVENSTIELNRSGGGNFFRGGGGAFLSVTNTYVRITATTIFDNKALGTESNGGGMIILAFDGSDVEADGLRVINNFADDDAGGVAISNSASSVTLRNSTISGNEASFNNSIETTGGLLLRTLAGGNTYIEDSTVSDNRTITSPDGIKQNVPGGGLYILNDANTTTTIRNTTISGNLAEGSGGGIKIGEYLGGGQVNIFHSTITNNRADSDGDGTGTGGGIHIGNSTTTVTLRNTIVAGNSRGTGTTGHDIVGTVTGSYNLIGDGRGGGIPNDGTNMIGFTTTAGLIDPLLGPLTNNGGPTLTHLPQFGSLAIDAGIPNAVADQNGVPTHDQRGAPYGRVVNLPEAENGPANQPNFIDIGAVEVQQRPAPGQPAPNDPLYNVAGDYNRNGVVDAADYSVWRHHLGQSFTLPNEDPNTTPGMVTAEDYQFWRSRFGATHDSGGGSLPFVLADFDHDQIVDDDDFAIWQSTFGSTTDLRADANGNGIVDLADYEIWFDTFGSTLAIGQFGLFSSLFAPDAPPAVVGFALSLSDDTTVDFASKVGSGKSISIGAKTLALAA